MTWSDNVTKRWVELAEPPSLPHLDLCTCQSKNCRRPLTHYVCSMFTWRWRNYRTGKAVSADGVTRHRRSCEYHARRFAVHFGLQMPRNDLPAEQA